MRNTKEFGLTVVALGLLGSGCALLFSDETKPPVVADAGPPVAGPDAGPPVVASDAGGARPGIVFATIVTRSASFAASPAQGQTAKSIADGLCMSEAGSALGQNGNVPLAGRKFFAYLFYQSIPPRTRKALLGWQTPDKTDVRGAGSEFALPISPNATLAVSAAGESAFSGASASRKDDFRFLMGSAAAATDNCYDWTNNSDSTSSREILYLPTGATAGLNSCCSTVGGAMGNCLAPPTGHLLCVEDLADSDAMP